MSVSALIFNQIMIVMLLIAVGAVCFKIGLISGETNKGLSKLVNYVVNPMVVFISFQKPFDYEHAIGLLTALGLAIGAYSVAMLTSYLMVRKGRAVSLEVERFSAIYPNCGFMGIPLVYGLFGTEGVFYLTAYLTMFNILVWTHGINMMGGSVGGNALKRIITTPAIVATLLGVICFVTSFTIPSIINQSLVYIGSMNTPMAMMVAGATLVQTNLLKALQNKRIYLVTFLKLALIPIIVVTVMNAFEINSVILYTTIIATASPTAITGTMFALTFDRNALYASEIFTATTVFSILTIPMIIKFAEFLYSVA